MAAIITIDNLERFLTNINVKLSEKQDSAQLFTLNNSNDTSEVSIEPNSILVFTTLQTFDSKNINIIAPSDTTREYTWTIRFQLGSVLPNITFNPPTGYTLRWANNTVPLFSGNGVGYEITFKYIPGVNLLLGVCGEF